MKKSELKQLIREVIEEIKHRDLHLADATFETDAELKLVDDDGNQYEYPDVPVTVYAFYAPSMYDYIVITNEDVYETDYAGKSTGKLLFKKGADVSDKLTTASFRYIYGKIEDMMK